MLSDASSFSPNTVLLLVLPGYVKKTPSCQLLTGLDYILDTTYSENIRMGLLFFFIMVLYDLLRRY